MFTLFYQKAEHSQAVVGEVKVKSDPVACAVVSRVFQVENIIGGMRGLKAMLWEASVLDPNEVGRAFRYVRTLAFTFLPSRAFVFTASPSRTAKRFFHLHRGAKR